MCKEWLQLSPLCPVCRSPTTVHGSPLLRQEVVAAASKGVANRNSDEPAAQIAMQLCFRTMYNFIFTSTFYISLELFSQCVPYIPGKNVKEISISLLSLRVFFELARRCRKQPQCAACRRNIFYLMQLRPLHNSVNQHHAEARAVGPALLAMYHHAQPSSVASQTSRASNTELPSQARPFGTRTLIRC